jgi:hypothetical protein
MNWEAIGAIGEILGAIAVLATLIYLAVQVRSTRDAWQRQNERDMLDGITVSSRLLIEQPDMPGIFWRGQEDFAGNLDDEEKLRFHQWMYLWITKIDQALRDHDLGGFVDDEQLNISLEAVAATLRRPGARHWWESAKWLFCKATQKRVEEAIDQGTRTSNEVVLKLR